MQVIQGWSWYHLAPPIKAVSFGIWEQGVHSNFYNQSPVLSSLICRQSEWLEYYCPQLARFPAPPPKQTHRDKLKNFTNVCRQKFHLNVLMITLKHLVTLQISCTYRGLGSLLKGGRRKRELKEQSSRDGEKKSDFYLTSFFMQGTNFSQKYS